MNPAPIVAFVLGAALGAAIVMIVLGIMGIT